MEIELNAWLRDIYLNCKEDKMEDSDVEVRGREC